MTSQVSVRPNFNAVWYNGQAGIRAMCAQKAALSLEGFVAS